MGTSTKRRKTTHLAESREGSTASTPTCVHLQKPPARTQIEAHGDLCLKVGVNQCLIDSDENDEGHGHKHAVIYTVDSRAVSRASSVWRAMLNGAFAESSRPDPNSNEKWTVELPDDDPTPMLIILNIIHNRFDEVPRGAESLSVDELYDLTVLTDKYDLTRLLFPWVKQWTAPLEDYVSQLIEGQPTELCQILEKLLWIAWELGDDRLFDEVYIHLASNTRVEEGQLVETDSETQLFSSGILEPADVSAKRNDAASLDKVIVQLSQTWGLR
ncbi:hypothetical protein SLS62_003476 [Diatrype stigma]|uniref:BTB domain-containing protein n=1 Tax=Diatrype stigma TaxID=117547 RepID=A0AAN9UVW6_9PEZI